MRRIVICLIAAAASPGHADCPPVPDRAADLDALIEEAREAPDERAGRALSDRMWEIWTDAPDEPAQALLDSGIAAIRVGDYATAYDTFDRLVTYCPDYAEGWNQRAFVLFLSGSHAEAVPDLERALELAPRHTGALTGLGLTLIALGREEEAQVWLRKAVALNPWLSERHLLNDAPGTDL